MENHIEVLQSIFDKAIAGAIKYDELLRHWEQIDDGSEVARVLFEDLADGIGHCPGYFNRPGIDIETWNKQREYLVLVCDKLMLEHLKTHYSNWLRYRSEILEKSDKFDLARISELISAKFS